MLAAAALILPPLTVFAPLGAAPLLAILAVVTLATDASRTWAALRGLVPLGGLLAALSLWATLSSSWSILPAHSLLEGLRLGLLSGAGMVVFAAATALTAPERQMVGRALMTGIALSVAFLLIERASGGAMTHWMLGMTPDRIVALTRYDRGSTTLALAVWPALAGTVGAAGRLRQVALLVVVVATILVMPSTTGAVAVLVGIGAFLAAAAAPRLIVAALAAAVTFAAVALPLATPDYTAVDTLRHEAPWIKFTAIHRLLIWRFTADHIAQRPLLGWGMDASRELPGGHRDFTELIPGTDLRPGFEALPLHPHDAALQWQVELGVPGTLLCLAIILWGLYRVGFAAQLTGHARAAVLGWATTALLIALSSYGAWQTWWLSCLWLTAAFHAAGGGVVPAATKSAQEEDALR